MKNISPNKRFGALILAVILVFSLASQAFAAGYKDVASDHWAEDYITELSSLGFFSGYEDGTFRPDGTITYIETFAMLSRMFDLEDEEIQAMMLDFASVVAEKLPSNLAWAKKEISICLAAGIVSATELDKLTLTNGISKKDFSLLLVRALQLDGQITANGSAALPFSDEASITGIYRGCVAILYKAKIVDGDDSNRFNPNQTVTRAVAAALLYRALNYAESNNILLTIPGYISHTSFEGIITNVTGSVVRILAPNGVCREYTIGSGKYFVNNLAATPKEDHVGSYIKLVSGDDDIKRADVTTDKAVTYVYGNVYSTSTTSNGVINIILPGNVSSTRFMLAENASITVNGAVSKIDSLKKNDYIFAKVVDGKIEEAYISNTAVAINGALTELTYGSIVDVRIKDTDGIVWYFGFEVSDLPGIFVGDYEISIDRLALGDKLTVNFENGEVVKIVSDVTQGSTSGQLTSIISTIEGTFWEITDADNKVHKYLIASDATAYKGKNAILLSSVKVGSKVSVSLYNSIITTVSVEETSAVVETGKITGTVLDVNTTSREIILLISDKLFYVKTSGSVPIYNASTGKALGLSQISAGSAIVAYGSYDSSTTLTATLVVVEALA